MSGYCKVCSFAHEAEINDKLRAGYNARQINDYTKAKWGFSATRQTWYSHKGHISASKPKAGEDETPKAPPIRRSSNKAFLEYIRDAALANAEANPSTITTEQGLKAASILEQSKQKASDITLILAQVVTGHRPDVLVEPPAVPQITEGTYREVATID